MQKIIYLIVSIFLFSCNQNSNFNLNSLDESDENHPYDVSVENVSELITQAGVYLHKEKKFLSISEINRTQISLSLFDRVVFDGNKKDEKIENKQDFYPLNKMDPKQVKSRVSTFCSYSVNQEFYKQTDSTEQKATATEKTISQELGSMDYHFKFSIIELMPKEILFKDLNKIFSCSFIFSFKTGEDQFDHYTLFQRVIDPSFNDEKNNIVLIQKTNQGLYHPIEVDQINREVLQEISLLNRTDRKINEYQLFCEGSKIESFQGTSVNSLAVPLNLLFYNFVSVSKGIKRCRFFAKNKKNIIGMTDSFFLDFDSLQTKTIDLNQVSYPVLIDEKGREKSSNVIPINSFIFFKDLEKMSRENKEYESIDLLVNTKCFNKDTFGKGTVFSKTYRMPLRQNIPIMSFTPTEVFLLNLETYEEWKEKVQEFEKSSRVKHKQEFRLQYRTAGYVKTSCMYQIKLEDKQDSENIKEFEDKVYQIKWGNRSYGINYIEKIDNISPFEKSSRDRKKFLRLEDISRDKAGYLQVSVFDRLNVQIDRINLLCGSGQHKDGTADTLDRSWSYDLKASISLKNIFLKKNVRKYIKKKDLTICRLILYEKDILRYFSGEMKITK